MYSSEIVSFIETKRSLLFYDYVIPINFVIEAVVEERAGIEEIESSSITFTLTDDHPFSFLPPRLQTDEGREELVVLSQDITSYFLSDAIRMAAVKYLDEAPHSAENPHKERATSALSEYLSKSGLLNATVDPRMPSTMAPSTDKARDPICEISHIDIIDTKALSWEKLVEFRQDKIAMEKLRRFRMFAWNNYTGFSKNQVEDDILTRLDDYNGIIRSWNFVTRAGIMSSVLNSKLLAGTGGASFLSVLLGAPLPAIVATAGAVGIELGKVAIDVQKRKFELGETLRNHPVSYMSELKSRFGDSRSGT